MLSLIWRARSAGSRSRPSGRTCRAGCGAPLYLALGLGAGSRSCPDVLHIRRVTCLVLLMIGGIIYSVGAIFYAMRRPNPWPTVFGHHEFFHACTLVAAICHHIAIYFALYA